MAEPSESKRGVAYGKRTLKVEPFGIERVPEGERHGRPWKLFPFWFGANVSLYSFLVGYLGITFLSLPVGVALAGIVLGTLLGTVPFAVLGLLGPATGFPQIAQSRSSFGRRGAYLPAALNWFSTSGWSAVTFILGALALGPFLHIPFAAAVGLFAAFQVAVALYGHNLLHRFEQVMAIVLAAVFALVTAIVLPGAAGSAYAPTGGGVAGLVLMTVLAASIPVSWAPYAADFSRYLAPDTPRARVFLPAFLGMAVSCMWVEVVALLVTARAPASTDPVAAFAGVLGPAAVAPLLVLVAVGLLAANAPNLYSSGLSLLALDVPVRRWSSVLVGGAFATVLALLGGANAVPFLEAWLLFVEYWIAPWAAIVLVSFFVFGRRGFEVPPDRAPPWRRSALLAYGGAVLVALLFMNQPRYYVGPISAALGGVDLSDLVSFVAAGCLFYALRRREVRVVKAPGPSTLIPAVEDDT